MLFKKKSHYSIIIELSTEADLIVRQIEND